MAYVNVPKDLSGIKSKIVFGLTKRQLLIFIPTIIIGLILFFLLRKPLGPTNAVALMMVITIPGFVLAMYERDGMYLDQKIRNIWRVTHRPAIRRYETDNSYLKPIESSSSDSKKDIKKKGVR